MLTLNEIQSYACRALGDNNLVLAHVYNAQADRQPILMLRNV